MHCIKFATAAAAIDNAEATPSSPLAWPLHSDAFSCFGGTVSPAYIKTTIMIRSRSIPLVLSRVAGDGIHAILLIDNDGELLGSYGSPPPSRYVTQDETNPPSDDTMNQHQQWPLEAASIGALISEVAGDYRRMGQDLLMLHPQNYLQRQGGVGTVSSGVDRHGGQLLQQLQQEQDGSLRGGGDGISPSLQQQTGLVGKTSMEKSDSGTNLKSLVVELDYVSASLGECYCNPYDGTMS